ncbi:hypothetical protein [Niastella populi]|uniref:DUF3592 domain-containing protein n=1 Tax=Niastella populi TaxID=550983 RepID=A0A1V9FJG2_9BACT|nr:hypothetical protein [Niastella populi]OQP58356.1 hypothetical protein A4R26_02505 [Niastella populi]
MRKGIFSSVRNFLGLVTMLLVAAIAGMLAWGSWYLYQNEKQVQQFRIAGQPVSVLVTATDRQNRAWYDQFSNNVYITFNYNNRSYTARYTQDSGSINEGDRVTLLYHPALDAFRQSNKQIHFNKPAGHSRLISFSITGRWSDGQKWLLLSLALFIVFILVVTAMITSVIQIPLLRGTSRFIVAGLVVIGALYFTYNGWQYYQYYKKIKNNSREETVTVLGTNSHARSKRSNWFYYYDATVQFQNEHKVIPIEEEDYQKLKPNDTLKVHYNSEENDMMPVNYTADHSNLVVALFMWCFAAFFVWTGFFKRPKNETGLRRINR